MKLCPARGRLVQGAAVASNPARAAVCKLWSLTRICPHAGEGGFFLLLTKGSKCPSGALSFTCFLRARGWVEGEDENTAKQTSAKQTDHPGREQ